MPMIRLPKVKGAVAHVTEGWCGGGEAGVKRVAARRCGPECCPASVGDEAAGRSPMAWPSGSAFG